jgi:ribosomal protein L27
MNVAIGKDFTLYALKNGLTKYSKHKKKTMVSIEEKN